MFRSALRNLKGKLALLLPEGSLGQSEVAERLRLEIGGPEKVCSGGGASVRHEKLPSRSKFRTYTGYPKQHDSIERALNVGSVEE